MSRRIHFIGIGGAGMSAIAKVLLERGHTISGSDLKRSRAATALEAMGASVHVGHDAALVEGAASVVVSAAIPPSNPELIRARDRGLDVMTRGEALAWLLRDTRSIVVAGTHGKTTTTSMIVSILRRAGLDPTYLVGAGLNDAGTNARFGRGPYAVAESDESDGSFLLLRPHIAVVTNVEQDHVDYWRSLDDLRAAFERFLGRVDPGGAVVVAAEDDALASATGGRTTLRFGPGGEAQARDVTFDRRGSRFVLSVPSGESVVELHVPGAHNVANALAAAAACSLVDLPVNAIADGLQAYRGVERRFQVRGVAGGVTVVDDYAHHPTEVRATLAAARAGPWERVIAVFQPHRYSRTAAFARSFGAAFENADRVVITDVYAAGELPVPGITGKLVADAVCERLPGRPVAYLPHRAELLAFVVDSARVGDAVLTLGAGDISTLGNEVLERLGAER